MTSIVGLQCTDGVVIGSDSSATFGSQEHRTIEQLTERKIEIVGNSMPMIVAGTGHVGLHQRFVDTVRTANAKKKFDQKSPLDVGRTLSRSGINDFSSTMPAVLLERVGYSAFVAFAAQGRACLCELEGQARFQPELKLVEDL